MGIVAIVLPPVAALSIAASVLVPGPAVAQNAECGVPLSSTPIEHTGEAPVFNGIDHDNRAFTLTQNPETGAWALWVISEFVKQEGGLEVGTPCIVVAGSESKLLVAPTAEVAGEAVAEEVASQMASAEPSAAADVETYRVDTDEALDLRTGAGTDFPSIEQIPPDATGIALGSCKPIDGYRYQWCEATWQGKQGWASACCLESERTGRRVE